VVASKWLDQGLLPRGPSVGRFLIGLGGRAGGASDGGVWRPGWAGEVWPSPSWTSRAAKEAFLTCPGEARLMEPVKEKA
jgi:hypothetical protein